MVEILFYNARAHKSAQEAQRQCELVAMYITDCIGVEVKAHELNESINTHDIIAIWNVIVKMAFRDRIHLDNLRLVLSDGVHFRFESRNPNKENSWIELPKDASTLCVS